MSSRQPLGISSAPNKHHTEDQRRHARQTSRDKGKSISSTEAEKISQLQAEVDKLHQRVMRRDETISTLKRGHPNHNGENGASADLQSRLEDLVNRYTASKTKHAAEIESLKSSNSSLQASLEESKAREAGKISDIRSKLALSEAENTKLRLQLNERVSKYAGVGVEERLTLRKEKAGLEVELRKVHEEKERASKLLEKVELEKGLVVGELKEAKWEIERLKAGGAVMAERCGELWELVRSVEEVRKCERVEWECERRNRESAMEVLQESLRGSKITIRELKAQLAMSRTPESTEGFGEIAIQFDRPHAPIASHTESHEPMVDSTVVSAVLDLALTHLDLVTTYQDQELDTLTASNADLLNQLENTIIALDLAQKDLLELRTQYTAIQSVNDALKVAHASCHGRIKALEKDLQDANAVIDSRGEEVNEVRLELRDVQLRADREREELRRAQESVQRGRFAVEALEEEVLHLQTCLQESSDWEAKYLDLLERQSILETREAMAIEEVEKMGLQQAELVGCADHAASGSGSGTGSGHVANGLQRINYVESVRREMALVRAELASTRTQLNIANDRLAQLQAEVEAYKCVDLESGALGVGSALGMSRTRVVRRQPEGGRVIARSVSASVGAGGRR